MVRLLAPILSFTCEEVWQHLPKVPDRHDSVHLANFPTAADVLGDASVPQEDPQQQQEWTTLLAVREQVHESARRRAQQQTDWQGLEAQ